MANRRRKTITYGYFYVNLLPYGNRLMFSSGNSNLIMNKSVNEQRLGQVTKDILHFVFIGALCCVALSSPVGAEKTMKFLWKETKKAFSGYAGGRLKLLHQAGYITTQGWRVVLTKRGRSLLARAGLEGLRIERHPWDRVWRCVAYDIPDAMTGSRRAFHDKLVEMGFVQIQKSVLVCPFRCGEQVGVAASLYGVEQYVLFMEANDLPSVHRLKAKFALI